MGRSGISRALERPSSRSLAGEGSWGAQRDVLLHRGATLRRDGSGEAVGGRTRSSAANKSESPKNGPPREGLSILYRTTKAGCSLKPNDRRMDVIFMSVTNPWSLHGSSHKTL